MVKLHREALTMDFDGTVIDIESVGFFDGYYPDADSRKYTHLPIMFGYLANEGINIYYIEKTDPICDLENEMKELIPSLNKPLYSFNTLFERAVIFNSCKIKVDFDHELNLEPFEPKWRAVSDLGIPNYDDPFNDVGLECSKAWIRGEYDDCILHNRSCLLKEKEIYIRRGSRAPDELIFQSWDIP